MKVAINRIRLRDDLIERAQAGREVVLRPIEALELAQHLDGVHMVNLYLEAAVRQAGGAIHLDTETILRSVGERWRYGPDRRTGHGGLLYLEEP